MKEDLTNNFKELIGNEKEDLKNLDIKLLSFLDKEENFILANELIMEAKTRIHGNSYERLLKILVQVFPKKKETLTKETVENYIYICKKRRGLVKGKNKPMQNFNTNINNQNFANSHFFEENKIEQKNENSIRQVSQDEQKLVEVEVAQPPIKKLNIEEVIVNIKKQKLSFDINSKEEIIKFLKEFKEIYDIVDKQTKDLWRNGNVELNENDYIFLKLLIESPKAQSDKKEKDFVKTQIKHFDNNSSDYKKSIYEIYDLTNESNLMNECKNSIINFVTKFKGISTFKKLSEEII